MSSIVSKDTKPEIQVRKLLHALGYRFRLHRKDLPGTPDIVLPRRKSVIFVHGCFWHLHPGCKRATMPKTNVEFWEKKLKGNVSRDAKAIEQLQDLGYRCLVIWECETKNLDELTDRLTAFLPR
ncbi:DNA mismatch endonuclease Vsr [Pseudodesulfovibrio sp. S3]|nr:very short patch repair endonuclease [Pseudodesulfovibrio sp. S3-i]RWU03002.1 DNA mismatch endonuclease Vsr [Pseudodesulfovibrio sp. S3]